jgi:GT2 family glycosyltransferase
MVPNPRVVYDCMDHHSGFANNGSTVLEAEARLVDMADLVIVTSESLAQDMHGRSRALALVRNATEYEHFAQCPSKVFADAEGRRILGYYGAIAEWFDPALVRAVAKRHPEALVLLIGADTAGVGEALADLPNVRFTGEVRYAELPCWLHAFDVCLLPFKVEPLTLATNPVKVYEYLSAGKAVVAVDLPEMRQFGGLVRTATSVAGFADAVDEALAEAPGAHRAERQAFAATQTWGHRASMLQEVVAHLDEPRVSVVVLTYNNLDLTRRCLESIERYSDYPALEVIVVDNASQDGSADWLRDWSTDPSPAGHVRRLILNDRNAGFAAGNNIGLRAATGDILVILNNDTQVTRGWIRTLRSHFRRDHTLGLIGPVTDNIGNEARVEVSWSDDADMHVQAGRYTRARPGGELRMHTAAFFCVAMPRAVYEAVGDLDESFGLGFFEDDDYCRRVEAAGYRIACAEDVFVHHHLSASFNKLGDDERSALFQRNRERYEAKWGAWVPHTYRDAEKAS